MNIFKNSLVEYRNVNSVKEDKFGAWVFIKEKKRTAYFKFKSIFLNFAMTYQ